MGPWDPIMELTITSPFVESNTCTMGNLLLESPSTLCQSRIYPSQALIIWPQDNSQAPQYFKAVLWIRRPNYQSLAGRYIVDYNKPMPELTYISQSGIRNICTGSESDLLDKKICIIFANFSSNGYKKIFQMIKCLQQSRFEHLKLANI
jgi:hypothetical protein